MVRRFLAILVLTCCVSIGSSQINRVTIEIGTDNDDLRAGSKVEVTFIVRGQLPFTTEVAQRRRFADRTTEPAEVTLPYSAPKEDFERINVKFIPDRNAFGPDKWEFGGLRVFSTGRPLVTLYRNNSIGKRFEDTGEWSTGVLPNFVAASGSVISVKDETGRPAAGATVYSNLTLLGTTDTAGNLAVTQRLDTNSRIVAKYRIHEQGFYRGNHSQDSTQNWNYRVYATNVRIADTGIATPAFDVDGTQVRVTVRSNQVLIGVNWLVSLEWDTPASAAAEWEIRANNASKYLHNATDGQFFIERFTVYDRHRAWNDSDMQVVADWDYRANANVGRFLGWDVVSRGMRLARGDNHPTYIHEFGHYGLCLWDEYTDGDLSVFCTANLSGTGSFAIGAPQASCMMWDQGSTDKICSGHRTNPHRTDTRAGEKPCWDIILERWNHPTKWSLKSPASRRQIPGRITYFGQYSFHPMMQTVATLDNSDRPDLVPRFRANTSGSSVHKQFARIFLLPEGSATFEPRATPRPASDFTAMYLGTTGWDAWLAIDGGHRGEMLVAMSADGEFADSVILGSGGTVNFSLGPERSLEDLFAQVGPPGGAQVNAPMEVAHVLGVTMASTAQLRVDAPAGVTPTHAFLSSVAGQSAKLSVQNGSIQLPTSALTDSLLTIYGKDGQGKGAFGAVRLGDMESLSKGDSELIGPGGAVKLDWVRGKIRGFGAAPSSVPAGWQAVGDAWTVLGEGDWSKAVIRLLVPGPEESKLSPKIMQQLAIYRFDNAKRNWSKLDGQTSNPTRRSLAARCPGPGTYAILVKN